MSGRTARTGLTLLAALLAACGGLIQGFDTGGISNAGPSLLAALGAPEQWLGIVTALVLIGAMAGALAGGPLADQLGRRLVLIGCGVGFAGGVALEITATALPPVVVGRLLAGLAIGAASCVSTLYISEISPPASRGRNLSFFQLAVVGGIACGIVVALVAGDAQWRILMGAGLLPAIALACGMALMPESPVWLARHGRTEAAARAASRLGLEPPNTRQAPETGTGPTGFSSPSLRLALVVGIGLALIQQVTGINAVMYYAPEILAKAGFGGGSRAVLGDLALALLLVAVTFLASGLVDRLGRRRLMLLGLGGMLLALAGLGFAFSLPAHAPGTAWGILAGLLVYIAAFAIGPGPCIWLIIAEIYPVSVRGRAMGAATLFSWLANFLVSSAFPSFSAAVGESAAFWMFALVTALSWLFTWALLPETGGRTLDEIQHIWDQRAGLMLRHHRVAAPPDKPGPP